MTDEALTIAGCLGMLGVAGVSCAAAALRRPLAVVVEPEAVIPEEGEGVYREIAEGEEPAPWEIAGWLDARRKQAWCPEHIWGKARRIKRGEVRKVRWGQREMLKGYCCGAEECEVQW